MSRLARLDATYQEVENGMSAYDDWFDAYSSTPVMGNTVRSEYAGYQPWYSEEYDSNWFEAMDMWMMTEKWLTWIYEYEITLMC